MIFIGHKIFLFLKKLFIGCIGSWGFPDSSVGKESAYNEGDLGLIPGLGRSPGEMKGYTFQYSGLENSMDYIVHVVAKSRIRLSNFDFHLVSQQGWELTVVLKLPPVGKLASPRVMQAA